MSIIFFESKMRIRFSITASDTFNSSESFEKFATTMASRSVYDFGVDVNHDDKILTLSTCYNDKGTRLVVQAKLVKIQER